MNLRMDSWAVDWEEGKKLRNGNCELIIKKGIS